MAGLVVTLSESPVKVSRVRHPKGCKVINQSVFLAWLDEVMLRLLKLAQADTMIAWSDVDGGHYVISLAVDVEIEGIVGEVVTLMNDINKNPVVVPGRIQPDLSVRVSDNDTL